MEVEYYLLRKKRIEIKDLDIFNVLLRSNFITRYLRLTGGSFNEVHPN